MTTGSNQPQPIVSVEPGQGSGLIGHLHCLLWVTPRDHTDTHPIVPIENQIYLGTDVVQAVILSKEVLDRYGIDLNSAVNGVYLPRENGLPIPGPRHANVHRHNYFLQVFYRLQSAEDAQPTRENIMNALFSIGKDLLTGSLIP